MIIITSFKLDPEHPINAFDYLFRAGLVINLINRYPLIES